MSSPVDSQPSPPIEWSGGPREPAKRVPQPADFYRNVGRVGILGFLASPFYLFWWLWQLFLFTRREGFPRARRFWWIFVPIYGYVVIYRQFDDLDKASRPLNLPELRAATPLVLLIASFFTANVSNRLPSPGDLVAFLASDGLAGLSMYLVQRAANDYLRARYPEAKPSGMTWGEITAAVLGLIWLGLVILGSLPIGTS